MVQRCGASGRPLLPKRGRQPESVLQVVKLGLGEEPLPIESGVLLRDPRQAVSLRREVASTLRSSFGLDKFRLATFASVSVPLDTLAVIRCDFRLTGNEGVGETHANGGSALP